MEEKIVGRAVVEIDPTKLIVSAGVNVTTRKVPNFVVFGRVKCAKCGVWCWLGKNSLDAVVKGGHTPMCAHCALPLISGALYMGHVNDAR